MIMIRVRKILEISHRYLWERVGCSIKQFLVFLNAF